MSDEKKYTERDLILAKREAFRAGAYWGIEHSPRQDALVVSPVVAQAESRYPLPKVTRARVVRMGTFEFKAANCDIYWREAGSSGAWNLAIIRDTPGGRILTADTVRTFVDLLANPTEEVDA